MSSPGYDSGAGAWSIQARRSGPRGPSVAPEERARIVDRLTRLHRIGDLTPAHIRQAAHAVQVSDRTIYRWLARGPDYTRPGSPRCYVLSETDWQAYEDFRGNIAAVYRARAAVLAGGSTAAGVPIAEHLLIGWADASPISRRTLYAAFARQSTLAERAYWQHGEKARRDRLAYRRGDVEHRNAVWQTDHSELDIVVLPRRGKPLRPWLTTFVDVFSRVILGWAIELWPDAGSVLSALRMALICDADNGGHGGVPAIIKCDHGREFTAAAITRPADTLGIVVRPVEKYEGRGKGVIERWHRSISQMLLTQLPGYTGGPRDKRGRLYGPVRDDAAWRATVPEIPPGRVGEDRPPVALPITAFARIFASWVRWFNAEHHHQGIGGRPPLQAWRADPTPITVIDPALLRDLLLVQEDATITSSGIKRRGLHYWAPQLKDRAGDVVDIRYAPHDDRFLEVYRDGKHLATATPSDAQTPPEAEAHRQDWNQEARRLATRRRRANARARRRIQPLTECDPAVAGPAAPATPADPQRATGPAEETRLVPTRAPRPANGHHPGRVRGSDSLLGFHEPRVEPPVATRWGEPIPDHGADPAHRPAAGEVR
jgi:putative transposase